MGPERIVCLTEEPTETLYLLGEEHRIVGISGFTVRPSRARREKPKVSAFLTAKIDKILALEPDLAIGFSDIQADIAQALIKAGVEVWISNHRSVEQIFDYVMRLGGMIGESGKASALVADLRSNLNTAKLVAASLTQRPRVYFEEWDDPQISGIRWVSELIEAAGGIDVYGHLAAKPLAKDRILSDSSGVIERAPDIIIGSWCGKRFQPDAVRARPGWSSIPAVRTGHIYEIKSPLILQPGPAALTDGLAEITRIISLWHGDVDAASALQ